MRIIAGSLRGRRLAAPPWGAATRPITDRVKEALFNRLMSLGLLGPGESGQVLDVFCGTGSLGLEALSRGADRCLFVDHDRGALEALRQNIDAMGLGARAAVHAGSALSPVWLVPVAEASVGLVFLDPPYALVEEPGGLDRVMLMLDRLFAKLEPGGVVVLRAPLETVAPPRAGWDGPASVTYGSMSLHLYQRPFQDDRS